MNNFIITHYGQKNVMVNTAATPRREHGEGQEGEEGPGGS